MNDSQMSETPQSPALKHYYKNKANVLDYYHKYYQLNKEKLNYNAGNVTQLRKR